MVHGLRSFNQYISHIYGIKSISLSGMGGYERKGMGGGGYLQESNIFKDKRKY